MDAGEQLKQDVREGRIDVDRLIDVIVTQQRQLEAALQELKSAKERIEELEKKAGGAGTVKVEQPFSMRAEEKRQQACRKNKKAQFSKNGRRGRLTSADKLKLAERTEKGLSRRRTPTGLSTLAYAAGVAFGNGPSRLNRLSNLSWPQKPIRQNSRRPRPQ
jgi:hypothetical protein